MYSIVKIISIALQITGTFLFGYKIIGLTRKRMLLKSSSIFFQFDKDINTGKKFIPLDNYISIFNENLYATIGIFYIALGLIINEFSSELKYSTLCFIALIIFFILILLVLTLMITKICTLYLNLKYIKTKKVDIDQSDIPDGATMIKIQEK